LTSLENEDRNNVRNSRRGSEGSARLGRLVHGRCPKAHRGYGGLLHFSRGLRLVGFPWSSLASPCVQFLYFSSVVQLTSTSTEYAFNT
jgi:hypothetical protein